MIPQILQPSLSHQNFSHQSIRKTHDPQVSINHFLPRSSGNFSLNKKHLVSLQRIDRLTIGERPKIDPANQRW